jgi:hypothetical protein
MEYWDLDAVRSMPKHRLKLISTRFGQEDQVQLPRPDQGHPPNLLGSGPLPPMPIRGTRTKVHRGLTEH